MTEEEPDPRHQPEGVEDESLHVVGEELEPPREVHDRVVAGAALLTVLGSLVFGGGLLLGSPLTLYGSGLAVALLALAVGVHRYFTSAYATIEAVEPRPGVAGDDESLSEVSMVRRRSLLGWLLGGAAGVLGLSLAAPVTSLGPAAGNALRRTAWGEGVRVVTTEGTPLRPDDLAPGSLVTAWPQGAIADERSAVVVLRLTARGALAPTEQRWVVDGALVAYSKICTHAGCPVGLFREGDNALFCPCHQATFDAARAAQPTFGPAARRLPQLPLGVDDEGLLVALGDFVEQIGPSFGWLPRAQPEAPQ